MRAALLPVAITGALALSCSGGGGSSGNTPPPLSPDNSSFTASWKPDTLVLDANTVAAKLRNPGATDGVYEFDPSATDIAALQAGQALVLTGVDLVKVDSVDTQADRILVTTEPASLLDAATDADVSWDVGADLAQSPAGVRPQDLQLESNPLTDCTGDAGPCVPKTSYSGKIGNLNVSQSMSTDPSGALKMTVTLKYLEMPNDPAALSIVATATLKSFRFSGTVVIQKGVLTKAVISVDDLELDMDLDAGIVALTSNDAMFTMPVELTFPYELGPFPAYFKVGGSIVLNSSLSSQSSAREHVTIHAAGSLGLSVAPDGTSISGMGSFDAAQSGLQLVDGENISTVTAGIGIVDSFPKVTFGLGAGQLASAEAYVTGKEEMVTNEVIELDGMGLIAGNCTTVNVNVGAFVGGKIRLLGLGVSQEQELFGGQHQLSKKGNPDQSVCM
jgi:hypothetical protein